MRIAPWEPIDVRPQEEPDAVHVYLRSRKGVCAARLATGDTRVDATDIVVDGEAQTLHYRIDAAGHFHGRSIGWDEKPVHFQLDLRQLYYGLEVQWTRGDQKLIFLAREVGVRFASVDDLWRLSARRLLQLRDATYVMEGAIVPDVCIPGLRGAFCARGDDIRSALAFKPHVPNKAESRAIRQKAARTHRRVSSTQR